MAANRTKDLRRQQGSALAIGLVPPGHLSPRINPVMNAVVEEAGWHVGFKYLYHGQEVL